MNAEVTSRALLGLISVFLVAASPSCQSREETSREEFLRKPIPEQRTAILQYPPAEQVELYLAAVLTQHPPDLGLADAVARSGSQIVPDLKRRIIEDERDIAKMYIVDVFSRMQELGYYSVVSDRETMNLLAQQVASIKDPQWKGMSSAMFDRIRAKQ